MSYTTEAILNGEWKTPVLTDEQEYALMCEHEHQRMLLMMSEEDIFDQDNLFEEGELPF